MPITYSWLLEEPTSVPSTAGQPLSISNPARYASAENMGVDIQLDAVGDIEIDKGDLVLTKGLDAIRQALLIRLRFLRGEWQLNTEIGVPLFESILGKPPSSLATTSIYRDQILATPGVREVTFVNRRYDGNTRAEELHFTAYADTGELLVGKGKPDYPEGGI